MGSTKRQNSFKILIIHEILIILSCMKWEVVALKHVQPKKAGSSQFKIAIFADLHFGENAWSEWGPKQDANSINAMSSLLDHENPDFVVYLGDVVTANNVPIANASLYWNQATSPTRDRGIPWAAVFGNHDDAHFEWPKEWFSHSGIPPLSCSSSNSSYTGDGKCGFTGTTRLELMTHQIGNDSLSFSQEGPSDLWPSVSNYVLQISFSDSPKLPVAFMYFLDSGGGSYPEVISSAQAEWLKIISEELNPDSRIPEIIFWHIPSKAYQKAGPWLFLVPRPCVGSLNRERVCTQDAELGIMKILEDRPSVQAIFVGHDHGNDWCCPYKNMWLCYARHTGYGGYGNWPRGARILEIVNQPFSLKSWIRMEDGFVHSHILLSSPPVISSPIFFLLAVFLVLFFGLMSWYPDFISKAKTFVSPTTWS